MRREIRAQPARLLRSTLDFPHCGEPLACYPSSVTPPHSGDLRPPVGHLSPIEPPHSGEPPAW